MDYLIPEKSDTRSAVNDFERTKVVLVLICSRDALIIDKYLKIVTYRTKLILTVTIKFKLLKVFEKNNFRVYADLQALSKKKDSTFKLIVRQFAQTSSDYQTNIH